MADFFLPEVNLTKMNAFRLFIHVGNNKAKIFFHLSINMRLRVCLVLPKKKFWRFFVEKKKTSKILRLEIFASCGYVIFIPLICDIVSLLSDTDGRARVSSKNHNNQKETSCICVKGEWSIILYTNLKGDIKTKKKQKANEKLSFQFLIFSFLSPKSLCN